MQLTLMKSGHKKWVKRAVYLVILVAVIWGGTKLFSSPDYPEINTPKPVFGNVDAAVKIVEFGDFQCPACKSAHPTAQRIKEQFGDDINFQFYHFPLRSIHPFAQKASEAVECANDQGKFWEYTDIAFENSPRLSKSDLKRYAADLGLDTNSFNACLDSGAKKKTVEGDLQFGVVQNVRGTPTFLVNNKQVQNWNYANFATVIEQELGR
jgi:protein-disulfide isomerase